MKPVIEMSRFELAAYIGAAFKKINVNVVLSGESFRPGLLVSGRSMLWKLMNLRRKRVALNYSLQQIA